MVVIVLIAHEKGGVGKSSVAVNIAALAASDGIRTLLLDTDPNGSTTGWLKTREALKTDAQIFTMMLTASPAKMVADQAQHYSLVVVDAGAAAWDTLLSVSLQSDLIILPVTPGQYEVDATVRVFEVLRSMDRRHVNGKIPAYALLNGIPTNSRSKEESELRHFLTEEYDIPVMTSFLRTRKAWRDSSKEGLALHEFQASQRDEKAVEEIRAVYEESAQLAQGN